MKVTAVAPSNIAFIKYWGKKDEILRLPTNGSISMNLSGLLTTTTIEFDSSFSEDIVIINGEENTDEKSRAIRFLDTIRERAGIALKAKIVSENNFPTGTGLSSSASGFAALTLAAVHATGLNLSEKELSILARLGSGSACRSIPDGLVEWLEGNTSETSYAFSLYPPEYWEIADVVVVISAARKDISTTEGQREARTSPFFTNRLERMPEKITEIKQYMRDKDFREFGELIEGEALELHAIMLTSQPSLIYWLPGTITVMKAVKKWRSEGLEVYFTVNTGQDVHLICQKKDVTVVSQKAQEIDGVMKTIINFPAVGARMSEKHLF